MQKIKDIFNKKKDDLKFKKAGPGYRLNDSNTSCQSSSNVSRTIGRILGTGQTVSQQEQTRRVAGPDENVAKATLARLETKNNPTAKQSTLYEIMNEEKQKLSKELKIREEIEEKRRQETKQQEQNENPFKTFEESQLFTCSTLDLNMPIPFKDIIRELKSSIYDNFSEDVVLRSAMVIFNCNRTIDQNEDKLRNCLDILLKIISNLMTDDREQLEKFKRIRKSKIEQKVLNLDGSLDFLFAIGFSIDEKDSDWLVYVEDDADLKTKMSYLKDLLSSPQTIPIELDRQVKLIIEEAPSKTGDVDLKMTSADMKEFYNSLERTRQIEEMVVSKETKAKMIANNQMGKFRSIFTKLRFKFYLADDLQIVEAIFYSTETLAEVKNWFGAYFSSLLQGKQFQFKQGLEILDQDSSTLESLKLSPASIIFIVFLEKK